MEEYTSQAVENAEAKIREALNEEVPLALRILGRIFRRYYTEKNRAEAILDAVKKPLRKLMVENNITRFAPTDKTYIFITRSTQIPNNKAGEVVYDRLVEEFGQELVDDLVDVYTDHIPVKAFKVRKKVFDKLSDEKKIEVYDAIDRTPSVCIEIMPGGAKKKVEEKE